MQKKSGFKILITSPKGGVGKSTISANLAAFLQSNNRSVTLLDFDNHGTSSSWLVRAPNIGVGIQHIPLSFDRGANRTLMDARMYIRKSAACTDVVICDLTWNSSIVGELLFEFDLVIIPTSISEIELAATVKFINLHRWVFESVLHHPPLLMLSPARVFVEQLKSDIFCRQRFPLKFILSPPILEGQSAKRLFERGYLMDVQDDCGLSFVEYGNSIIEALRLCELNKTKLQIQRSSSKQRRGLLETPKPALNDNLLLARHRATMARSNERFSTNSAVVSKSSLSSGIVAPVDSNRSNFSISNSLPDALNKSLLSRFLNRFVRS